MLKMLIFCSAIKNFSIKIVILQIKIFNISEEKLSNVKSKMLKTYDQETNLSIR